MHREVPPEKLTNIKNIRVISLLGSDLNIIHIGFTVFGNSATRHPIQDWEIDQHAENILSSALQKNSFYKVKKIKYDYQVLSKVYTDSVYNPTDFKLIESELRAIAQSNSLDTVLVLTRYRPEDPIGGRSIYYEGMGLYSSGIGETLIKVAPYVWHTISVVDMATLQPVAETVALTNRKNPEFLAPSYSLPYEEVDKSWWNSDFNAMSQDQKQQLQTKIKQLLSESIPYTLREAKLLNNTVEN